MTHAADTTAPTPAGAGRGPAPIDWASTIPFALAHLACLGAIWTGVRLEDVLVGLALFWARMFGITAGYHRYFAHRTFRTGRVFQFLLALLAQSSAQRGVLWWAATHRDHHKHSDTERDPHSPLKKGFWRSHLGWFFEKGASETDLARIPDFAKYPELVWLDRHPYLPAILLGVGCWFVGGWSLLVVGFFWSTVALWHATFSINSLAHVIGRRRYVTGDSSRNNWWLALLTFGEGWHNNHHYFPASVRQGFRWYELDVTWLILKALAVPGLVRDFVLPPESVVANTRRVPARVLEQAADELLARLRIEERMEALRDALAATRARLEDRAADWQARLVQSGAEMRTDIADLGSRVAAAATAGRARLSTRIEGIEARLADLLLDREELVRRARRMYADARVIEEVVRRAEARVAERLGRILAECRPAPAPAGA